MVMSEGITFSEEQKVFLMMNIGDVKDKLMANKWIEAHEILVHLYDVVYSGKRSIFLRY